MKKTILLSTVLLGLLGGNYVSAASLSTYTVQDNDTFWSISQKLNINLDQLLAANPNVDPNTLYGGLTINLPTSSKTISVTTPATNNSTTQYTIQAGDNFWSISQKLNISWNSLIAVNPNVNPNNLTIGQTINLPSTSVATTSTPTATSTVSVGTPTTNTYTIQAGDNFWSISQKLNISWNSLIAANPNVNPNNLSIGQVIQLPVANVNNQTSNATGTNNAANLNTSNVLSSTTITNASVSQAATTADSTIKPAWEIKADAIIATGEKYLGTPYVFGGNDPATGFDCSGFTQYAFGQNGISLPHNAAIQSQIGTPVSKDQLRKGDLVFLQGTYTTGVSHVGIYIGNNQVLQAGTLDGIRAVKISTFFGTPYYDTHYWGAQRIIKDNF